MALQFITDRALDDIIHYNELKHLITTRDQTADQMAEWLREMRGRYDVSTTMNRVGGIAVELARYVSYFYELVDITPKTDWNFTDTPTEAQLKQYLSDIAKLREAVKDHIKGEATLPSTMDNLSMDGANNIERVLYEIYELFMHFMHIYPASGIAYSGLVFYPITKHVEDDNV